jgi:hypothetical protein
MTFAEWLAAQTDRGDRIGELARVVIADDRLDFHGAKSHRDCLGALISARGFYPDDDHIRRALRQAWSEYRPEEYRRERRGSGS